MSPIDCHGWNNEDELYCAHCLTAQERWTVRCYRCDASFHGAGRFDLLSGRPHPASLLSYD